MTNPGSKDKFQQLKRQLVKMKKELSNLNNADGTETVTLDQSRVGRLSRMDALQTQQIALATKRRHKQKLLAIEAALNRIANDEYGYCFLCDEPISLARLEFDPTVTRCVKCQDLDPD